MRFPIRLCLGLTTALTLSFALTAMQPPSKMVGVDPARGHARDSSSGERRGLATRDKRVARRQSEPCYLSPPWRCHGKFRRHELRSVDGEA